MRITRRNRIMAFARIVGTVRSHAAKLLIGRDLAEQVGQHWGVANTTAGDFDRTDLKRFRIYTNMYLAPQAALGSTMLACVPLAFTLRLDASAIDQKVQWPCRTLVGDGDGQGSLSPAQGAVVRDRPVQPDKLQQTGHKPDRLPQRQAEQHFECQAGLYRCIAIGLLTASSPRWCSLPYHFRIKPDRERSPLLQ